MYRHLSLSQRLTIEKLYRKGYSQSAIARQLDVHRSTVKRELDRNSQQGEYLAEDAQAYTLYRKRMSGYIAQLRNLRIKGVIFLDLPDKGLKTYSSKHRRFSTGKFQRRGKRYQDYIPREDLRPYHKHDNRRRRASYHCWKSFYEHRYRFRDNALAESNRWPRDRVIFLSYLEKPVPPGCYYLMIKRRGIRKYRRRLYEIKVNEAESEMAAFERRLTDIMLKYAKEKAEQQELEERQKQEEQFEAWDSMKLPLFLIFYTQTLSKAYRQRIFLQSG